MLNPLRPSRPPGRSLPDLAAALGLGTPPTTNQSRVNESAVVVRGVTHDSRSVCPGDLFAALSGYRTHGAEFAGEAARAGAVAVLTDPAGQDLARSAGLPVVVVPDPRAVLGRAAAFVYGEPAASLLLIGVTGTSGKTTTAHLVESGLRAAGRVTGLIGTVETRIAGEVTGSIHTTPEATDLQALFAVMRERGVEAVSMEVSSHALAFGRVDGHRYDVAVFTNLSREHLDFHRDLETYFQTKAALFMPERASAGVVNVDDRYGRRLAAGAPVPVTTFSVPPARMGEGAGGDWRAEDVALGPQGSVFRIVGPGGERAEASVRLPGPFNVTNALGAVVALVTAGVPFEAAVDGVAALPGVPGRMERIEAGQAFLAVVDYAHKPDALENVLATLREVTKGRLIVVVGCGGDRDRAKRPLMGGAAAGLADVAVFTNDNPRSEDPVAIIAAMREGADTVPALRRADIVIEPDRAAAIRHAVNRAEPADTVLVAGKGHEQGQQIRGVTRPFDDRTELRRALLIRCNAPDQAGENRL